MLSSSSLKTPFNEDEILFALRDADGDKAPSPNRFSFGFFKIYWHVFKSEVLTLFNSFHTTGEFDLRFSESFISLIPKVKSPSTLNNFRPIVFARMDPQTHCQSSYKKASYGYWSAC